MNAIKRFNIAWLIPLIFLAGQFIICLKSEALDVRYIFLTAVLIVVSVNLIRRLGTFSVANLPLWIMLAVLFITYFIQFYWMVFDPQITTNSWFPNLHWLAYSPEVRFNSFLTATLGFATFGITAYIIAAKPIKSPKTGPNTNVNFPFTVSILIWLIVPLMAATSYIMYITGIGRMGAETVTLPFRLGGWIFHTRNSLILGLILLLIWCSDNRRLKKHFILGIILLLIHGITSSLLTSSRGAILYLFLNLLFLLILTGKLNKQRLSFAAIVIAIAIMLWPVISAYRYTRMPDHKVPITTSLGEAIESLYAGPSTYSEELTNGLQAILFRTGMISLFPIMGSDFEPLGTGIFDTTVTKFYTNDVLGFSPEHISSSAPSLFGWFYLLGGNICVIIGIAMLTVAVWSFWPMLARLKLLSLPVSQALFLGFFLNFLKEGSLDQFWLEPTVLAGSIAACEFILRFSRNKSEYKKLKVRKNEHSLFNQQRSLAAD